MCGIAGIVKLTNDTVNRDELNCMGQYMQNRGPDYTGIWINDNVGLCHTRLGIIDLSAQGNQPMLSNDKKTAITFNGEIYNFKQLKAELQATGEYFNTNSDTEVLLVGYKKWGINKLVTKINGMFAFCIYDDKHKRFYLVRDRLGKKPIYYYVDNHKVIFASDIKAVWHHTKNRLSLNTNSLDYYFSMLSVPQPQSIWTEINQLPPASILTFDIETQKQATTTYWNINSYNKINGNLDDIIIQTEDLLKESILSRTIADVPICCFLSGGVDSGLIVSILASNTTNRVNTFSAGFSNDGTDELADARKVAIKFNTNHSEVIIEPNIIDTLPSLIYEVGEPFADSSLVPSYYISKEMAKTYRVALSGDGGDELFGGYSDYGFAYQAYLLKKLTPPILVSPFVLSNKILSRLIGNKSFYNYGSGYNFMQLPASHKLFTNMGFNEMEKKSIYTDSFLNETNDYAFKLLAEKWEQENTSSIINKMEKASLTTRLLNDYLVKVDRASMMNSLEVRSPLLDYKLAEFAFSIPPEIKFKNFNNKYLLKKIAKKYFAPDIFERKKKGFTIPIKKWIATDLKKEITDRLTSGALIKTNYFNQEAVTSLLNNHFTNKEDNSHKIWSLLCFEMWLNKFK